MRGRQVPFGFLRKFDMLWTLCAILGTLSLVGVGTANSFDGLIHILLVVAVGTVVIGFLHGRRAAA